MIGPGQRSEIRFSVGQLQTTLFFLGRGRGRGRVEFDIYKARKDVGSRLPQYCRREVWGDVFFCVIQGGLPGQADTDSVIPWIQVGRLAEHRSPSTPDRRTTTSGSTWSSWAKSPRSSSLLTCRGHGQPLAKYQSWGLFKYLEVWVIHLCTISRFMCDGILKKNES